MVDEEVIVTTRRRRPILSDRESTERRETRRSVHRNPLTGSVTEKTVRKTTRDPP